MVSSIREQLTSFPTQLNTSAANFTSWRSIVLATVLLTSLFTALEASHVSPFIDDVDPASPVLNDWVFYKRYALSIANDGLTMPVVKGKYIKPHGFLYNYFVAGVFKVAGVNSTYVYVVQAAMLGISVGVMCLALRRDLSPIVLWLVFLSLAAFMYIDQFRNYTSRLLSENLVLFLLPLCFLFTLEAYRRRSPGMGALAGVMMGLTTLTRPNLLLFPIAAAYVLVAAARKADRRSPLGPPAVALLATATAVFGLLLWRNYLAAGGFSISLPWNLAAQSLDVAYAPVTFRGTASAYGIRIVRRIVFALGFTGVGQPWLRTRYHWIAIWVGVALFAARYARSRTVAVWQTLLAVFVIVSLVPVILISQIDNYGFRMVMPTIPALVVLGVYGAMTPFIKGSSDSAALDPGKIT